MDRWTDRLSDYLDGELAPVERQELEAHLESCEDCSRALEELRAVVARARRLEDRPPESDLWPGIRDRIEPGRAGVVDPGERRAGKRKRFVFTLPQLAAASIALMVVSGGAAWMMASGSGGTEAPAPVATASSERVLTSERGAGDPELVANFAERKYGAAIADLEGVLTEHRDGLDPRTVQVIEENLQRIDRAVEEARRALADDPASDYLNAYLAATMRQKLELLRRAAALAGASS